MESEARPLIRIEIQNDIANEMDVDGGEIEDGEVSGDENSEEGNDNKKMEANSKTLNIVSNVGNKWWNPESGSSTGFLFNSKNEQEKLTVRAQRFGIAPNESKSITEQQIQELYDSLNLSPGDEKMVRFDALHMRGVEEMSTKDIFGYFSVYGPSSIEWINDYSCNVVWLDNISASRALYGLSKRINGFDFTDEENPFVPKESNEETPIPNDETTTNTRKGRSILLISKENEQGDANITNPGENWESEEPIDITEISIPIPPGYWRYGRPHPQAKSILLRFSFKTDKKPFKAEKLSEYYKKHGNPNFGGMIGLISQSRKRQLKGNVGSERQVLVTDDLVADADGKNPWGTLAERWSNEDRGVVFSEPKEIIREPFEEPRIIITNKALQERIGLKRMASRGDSLEKDDVEPSENSDEKRRKVPRMRMYADEEQERINRLKQLKKLVPQKKLDVENKFQSRTILENNSDLRTRLQQTDRRRLPGITVHVAQNVEYAERRTVSNRFENRLGVKVTKNTFRSSQPEEQSSKLRDRISERVYESDEVVVEDDFTPDTRQRSTVKVVVRNRPKPALASTISRGSSSSHSRHDTERSWRISDREQFRSKNYDDPRRKDRSDLRSKINDGNKNKIRVHTTNSKLFRDVKKEPSSNSSESSDSDSESSSSESSSSSSESDSSSDDESAQNKNHVSVLKKTALPVKSDKKLVAGAKDTLRIEVHNDSYKKT